MDGRRLVAVFLVATTLISGFLALAWGKDILTAHQAMEWPTAPGTVVVSTTYPCRKNAGFEPEIRYEYAIAGRRYVGERIAFGPASCTSRQQAEDIAARYPAGHVTVWFDPDQPEKAALRVGDVEDGTRSSIYWSTTVCVVTLLLAIWCVRVAARTERRWDSEGF